MPRLRWLLIAGLAAVLAVVLAGAVVAPRIRARLRADWFERPNLTLAPAVKNLKEPTFLASVPNAKDRFFVLERAGLVRLVANGQVQSQPVLDLRQEVSSVGNEQGLFGLAFHPDFAHTGYVYVDYSGLDNSVEVVRYHVSAANPDQLDPASAQVVLSVPKGGMYHNGGMVEFGPDGMLYIGMGDDERSEAAQDLGSVLGKVLRLNIDAADPYEIPPSNPFVHRSDARPEVWASGLRNPWRFSFDRPTGAFWLTDVGEADREEVDYAPDGRAAGANYGWPMWEGNVCKDPAHCGEPGLTAPVFDYGHDMNCAIVGGYVYRGKSAPALGGAYIFGDLCTGGVFALEQTPGGWRRAELGYLPIKISSFGEDANGELYVLDVQGGTIYRVVDGSLPPDK